MNVIIPSILTGDFTEFKNILQKLVDSEPAFPFVQIDIMDNEFVANKSFPEREEINSLKHNFDFELHMLVNHPLTEIETWKNITAVKKILIPIECQDDLLTTIKAIRKHDWSVGLSINPETPLEKIEPYIDHIDSVIFLTVHPGAQGNTFLPEVGEKIKEFKTRYPHITCEVDGCVTPENIALISSWGTDYFCVGHALVKQPDINIAYNNLIQSLEN